MENEAIARFYRIVEEGMCIGCGLCQSMAGPEQVSMIVNEEGLLRPLVHSDLSEKLVDDIYAVCPGTHLEGLPDEAVSPTGEFDTVWGPYSSMVEAFAAEPEVRDQGSTGGVLTALARYLIASEEVDFIFHAQAGGALPTHGQPLISKTKTEVLLGAGSRYGPTALLVDVHRLLELGRPFAFVGKPCDISALRALALQDERVNALVKYFLTPVCGGFAAPYRTEAFINEASGQTLDEVTWFRYRGFGCPGETTFATKDGGVHSGTYTEYWGSDEASWNLGWRCKVCPDGIGDGADIAAADNWPGGSPDPNELDDPGTNAVIVRTERGQALMNAAVAAGFLTIGETLDPRHMDSVQPHQVKKKQAALARWEGMELAGHQKPTSKGLRLEQLRRELSDDVVQAQRQGAYERVKAGKAKELRPTEKPG